MKSAIVEREAGDSAAQRRLLEEGLRRFPTYWKLWLMLGQVGGSIWGCAVWGRGRGQSYVNGLHVCE
jgi:hypothetical protein